MNRIDQMKAALYLSEELLSKHIVVACITCQKIFLNKSWKEYLQLLHGDYFTPTKWYNEVVLHYCESPTHEIISNRTILQGVSINQPFDFTKKLKQELEINHCPIAELYKVALIEKEKTKDNLV